MVVTRHRQQLQGEGLRGQKELPYGSEVLNLVFLYSLVTRSPRGETTLNFTGVINLLLGYLAVTVWVHEAFPRKTRDYGMNVRKVKFFNAVLKKKIGRESVHVH